MNKKLKASFYTLGCRVNQYETRAVEESFIKAGFEIGSFSEKCDVYVINTCTVTGESDRKSRQMIRRAVKCGGNDAVVAVMGCMSQTDKDVASAIPGVSVVIGNGEKMSCVEKVLNKLDENAVKQNLFDVTDIFSYDKIEEMSVTGSDNTRAFLKVVDGCENKCSYCIIPSARGRVRSKPADKVYAESKNITDIGLCREIVLTGIETAAYGKDIGSSLDELVKIVAQNKEIRRIRLGSLEPTVLKEDFVKALSEIPVFMPHFHLSLQSGSDGVLARMKRKYNTKMFYDKLLLLKKHFPNLMVTTDIIVGFPGETEKEFQETAEFVRKCGFLYAHIFPYSDRKDTPASKMDNKLSDKEKQQRAKALNEVMLETRQKVLQQMQGKQAFVLCETVKNGYAHGYTENYVEVRIKDTTLAPNDIVKVTLTDIAQNAEFMYGKLLEDE